MTSSNIAPSLAMTTESGHKLYMVYSTKSCPELIEQFENLIESHGDAHGLNDADASFSIRIDYDRERQNGDSETSSTPTTTSFKPSKDRAIAALSDKFYSLLTKEGFTGNNKIIDLRVVPFRYHKSHTPGKEFTFSIFIQLPITDVPFAHCQSQLSASMLYMENFSWFTNKQYNIVYPTFSRESGKSRGTAMIFFDRTVSKDNIIKVRLMLEHSKMTISENDSESENFINIRAMWALLTAVHKQFPTRAKTGSRDATKSSNGKGHAKHSKSNTSGKGPVAPTVRIVSKPVQVLTKMVVKAIPSLEHSLPTDSVYSSTIDVNSSVEHEAVAVAE